MAGTAVIQDARMVKACRYKAGGIMTYAAVKVSGYVISVLAACGGAVVAGSAIVNNALMVKGGAGKCACIVADRAVLCGGNVIERFAGGINPVVAACLCAVINNTIMIEYRRGKSARYMTNPAV